MELTLMPCTNTTSNFATLSLDELMSEFDSEVERLESEQKQREEEYNSGLWVMKRNFSF